VPLAPPAAAGPRSTDDLVGYPPGMFLPDPSGHRDVALGLCRTAGRVLLVWNARSAQGLAQRFWDLPGGTVEAGEGLKEALAREWEEEVGWTPTVGALALVVDGAKRRAPDAPPLYTWRTFVFDVPAPPFGVLPRPGPEIEKIEIVRDVDAVMRLSAPYHGPLREHLRGDGPRHATVSWIEPEPEEGPGARPAFGADVRSLLVLAAAGAVGDAALVASEAAAARDRGLDPARIEEALLQLVPYAGFPRTLAAFAAARPPLGPSSATSAEGIPVGDRAAVGDETFATVYAESADRVRRGLEGLHPLLPAWTTEFAYGRVLAREALGLPTRELLAVAILTALGRCDDALLGHMRAAVRLGASAEAVAGAIAVVPPSAGAGRRAAARAALARLGG